MGTVVQWVDVVAKYRDAGSSGDADTYNSAYILPAESYVKGILLKRYSDPLTNAGYVIKDIIIDEAYRRSIITKNSKKANEIQKSIKSQLKEIMIGSITLINSNGNEVYQDRSLIWSSTEDYTPTFGMGDIVDMEVDPDQTDDEEDER